MLFLADLGMSMFSRSLGHAFGAAYSSLMVSDNKKGIIKAIETPQQLSCCEKRLVILFFAHRWLLG
jgi:hypothetical protein